MNDNPIENRTIQLPAGYPPEVTPWVWGLEDTRRRTLKLLGRIDPAALDWSPPEGGNTIGTLLYHLAAIEMSYLYEDILEKEWAPELDPLLPYPVRTDDGRLAPVHGETMETHLERLAATRALLLGTLKTISTGELLRPRRVENYIITPEWALHHLMQHEAEHRGQISELWVRVEREKQ